MSIICQAPGQAIAEPTAVNKRGGLPTDGTTEHWPQLQVLGLGLGNAVGVRECLSVEQTGLGGQGRSP